MPRARVAGARGRGRAWRALARLRTAAPTLAGVAHNPSSASSSTLNLLAPTFVETWSCCAAGAGSGSFGAKGEGFRARFGVEPDALRGMLNRLIRKGRVRRLPSPQLCGGCRICAPEALEFYEWAASRPASEDPAPAPECCTPLPVGLHKTSGNGQTL